MISLKNLQEKLSKMHTELGGINSFFIVLEKNGESIATFDGQLEETCSNLAEGFDYFVSKAKENGVSKDEAGEILQDIQSCLAESVSEAFAAKNNLKLVK